MGGGAKIDSKTRSRLRSGWRLASKFLTSNLALCPSLPCFYIYSTYTILLLPNLDPETKTRNLIRIRLASTFLTSNPFRNRLCAHLRHAFTYILYTPYHLSYRIRLRIRIFFKNSNPDPKNVAGAGSDPLRIQLRLRAHLCCEYLSRLKVLSYVLSSTFTAFPCPFLS